MLNTLRHAAAVILLFTSVSNYSMRSYATDPAPAPGWDDSRLPVVFGGGHETDPRDRGRPVVLVAGALGVTPEVFRAAFSKVHPAGPGSGGPTQEEARANKAALMAVLGPLGVTNDRLDEVSNYYRYVRSRGELWPVKEAVAVALVRQGTVVGYEVTDGGAGYSSAPTVTVPGAVAGPVKVELKYGADFQKNGTVVGVKVEDGR